MEKKKNIQLNSVIVQKKELDTANMDGEIVMMNMDKGKYYGLNSIGSRIWELIEESIVVTELISQLTKEFNVDANVCKDNVLLFLNRLYDEEIILLN